MSYKRATPFANLGKSANVGSWIDDKWNKGQAAVTGAYDAVSSGIDNVYNAGAATGNAVYNGIENNVVAPVVGAVNTAIDKTQDVARGIGQIGVAAGNSLRNTVMAPVNVALGAKDGLIAGAQKGLGGAVQGALDGGWNAGKQVGKDYTSASRQLEAGVNQAGFADTQSHGLTSLGATRTPGVGLGSAVPTTQAPPVNPSVIGAPRAVPVPSPTGYGQPKAAPAADAVNNGHAASAWQQDPFRKTHGGAYNPNLSMDRQKMQGIAKSAFAQLEKEAAPGLAGALSRGVKGLGNMLSRSSNAAKRTAMNSSLQGNGFASASEARASGLSPSIVSGALDDAKAAVKGTGNARRGAGKALANGAGRIEDSKGIQNAINYGSGAIAGTGALYGAHSMGRNSGHTAGIHEGVENGMELGMQGAQAMQPGDPGFMGRLSDLFTGTQQGPDTGAVRQQLTSDRDKLIQQLIAG